MNEGGADGGLRLTFSAALSSVACPPSSLPVLVRVAPHPRPLPSPLLTTTGRLSFPRRVVDHTGPYSCVPTLPSYRRWTLGWWSLKKRSVSTQSTNERETTREC